MNAKRWYIIAILIGVGITVAFIRKDNSCDTLFTALMVGGVYTWSFIWSIHWANKYEKTATTLKQVEENYSDCFRKLDELEKARAVSMWGRNVKKEE